MANAKRWTRRDLLRAIVLCALVAAGLHFAYRAVANYLTSPPSLAPLPLDDAYIHLNYARSIAVGQPYQYNPGDPPTSGATSLLYPYLLVPGILLAGDQPLYTVHWSAILGSVAFAIAGVGVAAVARAFGTRSGWGVIMLTFMLSGLFMWHAMSGMETMLITAATLLALYGVAARSLRWGVIGGALCALLRPEGSILAALTSAALYIHLINAPPPARFVRLIPRRYQIRRELLVLLIPIAAIGVQPLVNLLFTGAPGSTGGSAKSLLGMVPFDAGVVVGRIAENFIRIWRDLLIGNGPDHTIGVLFVLAIAGWIILYRRDRLTALTIALWALLLAGAIATLDTAFWHFRRYQIPLIAVVFPLAGVSVSWVLERLHTRRRVRLIIPAAAALLIALTLISAVYFTGYYAVNVLAIREQPDRLARDLAAYPDRDARVAVHDVGLMRYIGGLDTIDMVGLTTPGAAAWWRQGPGAVGEYLDMTRPDLIAAYGEGHGVGLGYLANTDLYAETLAEYTVQLDESNVALAAPTQGLYRPDYATADNAMRTVIGEYSLSLNNPWQHDYLDVANLDSEAAHDYRWWNNGILTGFATEWHQFPLAGCMTGNCLSMDGGRRITGGEEFTLTFPEYGDDFWLVARVHPGSTSRLIVSIQTDTGHWVPAGTFNTFDVPEQPGLWLDVPFYIGRDFIGDRTEIRFRIRPVDGSGAVYEPYAYSLERVNYFGVRTEPMAVLATFPDSIVLEAGMIRWDLQFPVPTVGILWFADHPTRIIKRFVHVSDAQDNIVAQVDGFVANGALPSLPYGGAGEWVELDLTGVAPGTYTVYVGLYDAATLERLPATGDTVDSANRVNIGTITIKEPAS